MRILIRVPNWLGDTMMATPAVSAVREMMPEARLTVLTTENFEGFWKEFPGVDEVLTLGKKDRSFLGMFRAAKVLGGGKFDLALVLPSSFSSAFMVFAAGIPGRVGWGGEGRGLFLTRTAPRGEPRQKHLVWEYLDLVHFALEKPVPFRSCRLVSPLPASAEAETKELFKSNQVWEEEGLIALAPGATYGPAKRWPLDRWKELIQRLLAERKEALLVLGGPEESAYLMPLIEAFSGGVSPRVHFLAGQTKPLVLASVLARCRLLITNDTGPMHVAAAVGTPTVALFGSTSPVWTRPFGLGHTVIYKNAECSPCFQRTCPIGYLCLNGISVEEVFQAAEGKLEKPVKVEPEPLPETIEPRSNDGKNPI